MQDNVIHDPPIFVNGRKITEADWRKSQLNREAFKGISHSLTDCTAAIVDSLSNDRKVGSGVFVRIDDLLFFATAAHCIPDSPEGRVCFVQNVLANFANSRAPIIGFGRHADVDVGYLELAPDADREIGKTAIPLDRIAPRGAGEIGRLAYVAGFPGELIQTNVIHARKEVECEFVMMFYAYNLKNPSEWPQNKSRFSEDVDLLMNYDRDEKLWQFSSPGLDPRLADPAGTSGGGWWQGTDTVPESLRSINPTRF